MGSLHPLSRACTTPAPHSCLTVRISFTHTARMSSYTRLCLIGSVLVSGSNPNADYNVGPDVKFPTEYRVEKFYPLYYNEQRPQPQGLPKQISYGGPYFNVSLSAQDLGGNVDAVTNTSVIIIRTGFSTHTMVRTSQAPTSNLKTER